MRNKCWGCFFLSKNIKIVKKVFTEILIRKLFKWLRLQSITVKNLCEMIIACSVLSFYEAKVVVGVVYSTRNVDQLKLHGMTCKTQS